MWTDDQTASQPLRDRAGADGLRSAQQLEGGAGLDHAQHRCARITVGDGAGDGGTQADGRHCEAGGGAARAGRGVIALSDGQVHDADRR